MKTAEKFTIEVPELFAEIKAAFSKRNYPLPHPDNIAAEDVSRIREAIILIDQDITALEDKQRVLDKTLERLKLDNFFNIWR